jgi:hypothetical protein
MILLSLYAPANPDFPHPKLKINVFNTHTDGFIGFGVAVLRRHLSNFLIADAFTDGCTQRIFKLAAPGCVTVSQHRKRLGDELGVSLRIECEAFSIWR